jgi:DNA-binding phage protein
LARILDAKKEKEGSEKAMSLSNDHEKYLLSKLVSPKFAAEFINATLEDAEELSDKDAKIKLLDCLRLIIKARGGVTKFAKKTKIERTALTKMTSAAGNPTLLKLLSIFNECGLKLRAEARSEAA